MLKEEFDEIGIPFYSYTHNSEKEHAFVIRGLDNEPATTELKETLEQEFNMCIHKCFKLTTKGRPLHMFTTTKDYKIRRLNAEIKSLHHKGILGTQECQRTANNTVPSVPILGTRYKKL